MSLNIRTGSGLDRRILFVLAAALALRLAYGISSPKALAYPDARSFDSLAWNLTVNGQYGVERPTAARPPAYVLFLAGIYKLAGHDHAAALAAQALMGTLLVFILISISRRLSDNPDLPLVTGLFAACYPFFIYYETHLLSDSFLTFTTALSFLLFIRWKELPLSWGRAGACGLVLSVTALTKPPMIAWAAFIFLTEAILLRGQSGRPARFMRILTAALAFSVPILIWGARNKAALGEFALDNHGGSTLAGTIIFNSQTKAGRLDETVLLDPFYLKAAKLTETEQERYYIEATREFIKTHPKRYVAESLIRFKDFWRFYPRPDVQFQEGALRLIIISLLTEPFLIIAGLFTLFLTRPARALMYPASYAIIWLTLLHSLITGQMRYRLPLMPFMILGAAYWLSARIPADLSARVSGLRGILKTVRWPRRSAEKTKS